MLETAADDLILWILKQYLLQGGMFLVVTTIVTILVLWLYEIIIISFP